MTPSDYSRPLTTIGTSRPSVPYYQLGDIECIDALRSALGYEGFMGFCRGNVIKYMWRAGRKGTTNDAMIADVNKAISYCNFILETLQKGGRNGAS